MNTITNIDAHMKIFQNYKEKFGVSPSGLTNIYHLERWLRLGIATINNLEDCVAKKDYSDENYCNIFVEDHWNYAIEVYFRHLKSTSYDLSSPKEIGNFVWEVGEELHWYMMKFARDIINEMLTKYTEEGILDLCYDESIEQFCRDACEEIQERLGIEDSTSYEF